MAKVLSETLDEKTVAKCMKFARKYADKETRKTTYQAMEALVHNLNTMHSRAGAQIPFSSLNYGTEDVYKRQPGCRSFISKRSPVSDLRQVKK